MFDLQSQIREKLYKYVNGVLNPKTYVFIDDIKTVWFMYTRDGWKTLLIITRNGDYERYYELTYVASEGKTYIDTYFLESQSVILG